MGIVEPAAHSIFGAEVFAGNFRRVASLAAGAAGLFRRASAGISDSASGAGSCAGRYMRRCDSLLPGMEIPGLFFECGTGNRVVVRPHFGGVTVTGGLPESVAGETVAAGVGGLPRLPVKGGALEGG